MSTSSSEEVIEPCSSTEPVEPVGVVSAPPGLGAERLVRRVSRQNLQVPGSALKGARRQRLQSTPIRSTTIHAPGDDSSSSAPLRPLLLPRYFTTEPARSSTLDFEWDTESREQLRHHMAHQLQQIQQLQLQQLSGMSPYELQQQQLLQFQQYQRALQAQQALEAPAMKQMRAQSLREPMPQPPSKALRRIASAAERGERQGPQGSQTVERSVPGAVSPSSPKSTQELSLEVTPVDSEVIAPRSSTEPVEPVGVVSAPPELGAERLVRRVSRQNLQVPGSALKGEDAAARRQRLQSTPVRSTTIHAPGDDSSSSAPLRPLLLPRSFTTEPARSSTLDFEWDTESREQLRHHMAHQLQQIHQLQLQQVSGMSQYDLQQQQLLQFQQYQRALQAQQTLEAPAMKQMRAQSLREPMPQPPSKALRRIASAAERGERQGHQGPQGVERSAPGAVSPSSPKSTQKLSLEVTPVDSEAELQVQAEEVEIVVGPTQHAVLPLSFEAGGCREDQADS
ncbi:unnamed protein product [Durusdinium trenchii]|uniref:Uncharacterized protein n=1 Tax=Durusdinium trenchii TaxID=1381693 RepID=A0ABP0IVL0_9DINO